MKIRIKGNTIRFRLTRSEVADFCEQGFYEDGTEFDTAIFSYGLRMDDSIAEIRAVYVENTITLIVPEKMAANWDATNRVGFENTVSLENGKALHVILEKDFTCLDDRGEDETDNYPNPKMASRSMSSEKE